VKVLAVFPCLDMEALHKGHLQNTNIYFENLPHNALSHEGFES